MSNQLNLSSSQQSIDTILKLSIDLRKELLEQLESFNLSKNNYLLIELKKLFEFKNKEIINQTSYLEININQVEKIIDILHNLEGYNQLKNPPNNLTQKLDKIKDEIVDELIMLPAKLCLESEINENINLNNDQHFEIGESNYNDKKVNKLENKLVDCKCNKIVDDVWRIIFKELSIQDLLSCRLVNKKFKHFSDNTNGINKLIIGQPHLFGDYFWYYNYKSIEDKDIINFECFRVIKELKIFNLDTNLKYLKIYDSKFKLEEISNLINLESIELGHYKDVNNNQKIINLNNLKVFITNRCSIQLNAPKLDKIQFNHINQIKLNSNPELIKHLITRDNDNKLEIFKNLEIMELQLKGQLVINENLLSLFKNLKQLKINLPFYRHYSDERIKNNLIRILTDKNRIKIKLGRVIDIYMEGVKIENIDKFNELVSIEDRNYWKFRLNNYDLLDLNLSSINKLDYEELEKCVNNIKNDLPTSFFDKFIYIDWVSVEDIVNDDIDGLNWVLNKLKYLNRLEIYFNVSLGQNLYNNLPNTIRYLKIDNNSEDISYEFILKLSKLIHFETNAHNDLFDLAFKSFSNLKYFIFFRFTFKKKEIRIEKDGKYFNLNGLGGLDYNQLKEECNKIRSK